MASQIHQELERLEGALAQSDPALAGKYGIFNRLTEDEPFARAEPVPEQAPSSSPVPGRVPPPRPEGHASAVPIPRPGAPWGPGLTPGGSFFGGKGQPLSWHAREQRTGKPGVRAPLLGPWIFPLLMFFVLAIALVVGLSLSA
jgi:hypothetical protein